MCRNRVQYRSAIAAASSLRPSACASPRPIPTTAVCSACRPALPPRWRASRGAPVGASGVAPCLHAGLRPAPAAGCAGLGASPPPACGRVPPRASAGHPAPQGFGRAARSLGGCAPGRPPTRLRRAWPLSATPRAFGARPCGVRNRVPRALAGGGGWGLRPPRPTGALGRASRSGRAGWAPGDRALRALGAARRRGPSGLPDARPGAAPPGPRRMGAGEGLRPPLRGPPASGATPPTPHRGRGCAPAPVPPPPAGHPPQARRRGLAAARRAQGGRGRGERSAGGARRAPARRGRAGQREGVPPSPPPARLDGRALAGAYSERPPGLAPRAAF